MSRIGVTGASGYIGQALLARLHQGGHEIVAIGRRGVDGTASHRRADLREPVAPDLAQGLDALVHLAADTGAGEASQEQEIVFARALVDACAQAGCRLLFVSSQAASPTAPSAYGRSKAAIEALVLAAGGVVVRPGMVYGGASAGLFGMLESLVMRLPVLPALVWPAPRVQPVHVDDLALALSVLAVRPPADMQLFRLGTAPMAFGDFLQAIARSRLGRRRLALPVPVPLLRAMLATGSCLLGPRLSPARLDSLTRLPPLGEGPGFDALGIVPRTLEEGLRSPRRVRRALLEEARRLARALLGVRAPSSVLRRYARALPVLGVPIALELPRWLGASFLAALDTRRARAAAAPGELAWRFGVLARIAEADPRLASRFLRATAPRSLVWALAELFVAGLLETRSRVLAPFARLGLPG